MSNKNLLLLLKTTLIIAFDLLFFLLKGFNHSVVTWIAFIILNGVYLSVVFSSKILKSLKSEITALNYSFYRILFIYFIVVLVTSLIIIVVQPSIQVTLSIYVVLIVILIFIFVITGMSNQDTQTKHQKIEYDRKLVFDIANQIKDLNSLSEDKTVSSLVNQAYEIAMYSNKNSTSKSVSIEQEVVTLVDFIKQNKLELNEENLKQLILLLEKRNDVLKK